MMIGKTNALSSAGVEIKPLNISSAMSIRLTATFKCRDLSTDPMSINCDGNIVTIGRSFSITPLYASEVYTNSRYTIPTDAATLTAAGYNKLKNGTYSVYCTVFDNTDGYASNVGYCGLKFTVNNGVLTSTSDTSTVDSGTSYVSGHSYSVYPIGIYTFT